MTTNRAKSYFIKGFISILLFHIISLLLGLHGLLISRILQLPAPWNYILQVSPILIFWITLAVLILMCGPTSKVDDGDEGEDDELDNFVPPPEVTQTQQASMFN